MDLYRRAIDIASSPRHARWLSPLLISGDAVLCSLIVWKIPYTEIDWKAYMEQVAQYRGGERDYTAIKGGTGPLVYPAAHLYMYTALHAITDGGKNIMLAQIIFLGLYLASLNLVMACYRQAKAPPYVFPLLVLSKRLHSIFLLRLFNDGFAVAALFGAIYAYQRRSWTIGSIVYSWGVGIKMSLLLALPAISIILLQALPLKRFVNIAFLIAQVQLTIAFPFLSNATGYINRAFEFSRRFLYRWTVNFKFIPEDVFQSPEFSFFLAIANLTLLLTFLSTRWIRPTGNSLSAFLSTILQPLSPKSQQQISLQITPSFIMTTVLSSMAVGMLCARSLHYQFYAYIAWSTPFLLWRSGIHPVAIYVIWTAQEYAWNVYPSTRASSMIVVGCLLMQVTGVWLGTRRDSVKVSNGDKIRGGEKPVLQSKTG